MLRTHPFWSTLLRTSFFLGVLVYFSGPLSAHSLDREISVPVTTVPLIFDLSEPSRTRFGALEWRGGIDIRSTSPVFGGLSGLILRDNGASVLGISDEGRWMTADLTYSNNRVTGIGNVRLAPLLGTPGEILIGKHATDSEGIGLAANGDIFVSFERHQRIARYDFDTDGVLARADYLPLPDETEFLAENKGLEAIGQFPAGSFYGQRILVLAERYLDSDGNHTGWILGAGDPIKLQFARVEDFDFTALTFLPDGRLIILERAFSILFGPAVRLRLVEEAELRSGKVIVGRELMRADTLKTIDNMEGLTNHVSPTGETILTIVSDNNFQSFQRTLLMQFALR